MEVMDGMDRAGGAVLRDVFLVAARFPAVAQRETFGLKECHGPETMTQQGGMLIGDVDSPTPLPDGLDRFKLNGGEDDAYECLWYIHKKLTALATAWHKLHPTDTIYSNDISFHSGGPWPSIAGHEKGVDVNLHYMATILLIIELFSPLAADSDLVFLFYAPNLRDELSNDLRENGKFKEDKQHISHLHVRYKDPDGYQANLRKCAT